jgi:hypothetical protein
VGGVDERGSRKPPPYVPDAFMSGIGPAIDFVGPAWMVLTYGYNPEGKGFYDEGWLTTTPDISKYPNMMRLPKVEFSATNMSRVSAAAGVLLGKADGGHLHSMHQVDQ